MLIDEDRSATNFMIRDDLMKKFIKHEPIIPFTDRVQELSANGVSTILVIGGSGEYLYVADSVYIMEDFMINDATELANEYVKDEARYPNAANWNLCRKMTSSGFTSYPESKGTEKMEISDTGFLLIGDEKIDARALHGIVTTAQLRSIGYMLRFIMKQIEHDGENELEMIARTMRGLERNSTVREIDLQSELLNLFTQINEKGFDIIDTNFFCEINRFFDLPRKLEFLAAVNRMRLVLWTEKHN